MSKNVLIQNIRNYSSNTCDSETKQYCQDGYVLYFPCLKDITKGQDICFDFYIADNSTQDVIDLRDVDAITLNLIGQFNCAFGSFSYPDNISSLQLEGYSQEYSLTFDNRIVCELYLDMIDVEDNDSEQLNSKSAIFYSGTEVEVAAYDTNTHIFIGWARFDESNECDDNYEIISDSNKYRFTITEDTQIFALYRPRKVYKVVSDPENKFSHFNVNYNNVNYITLSNRDGSYDDEYDFIEVLEGYSMTVICKPSTDVIGEGDDTTYEFVSWKDGNKSRCRVFVIGVDTKDFEDNDFIKLKATCTGPVPYYEQEHEYTPAPILNIFDEDGIHILTDFSNVKDTDYYNENTLVVDHITHKFINENGYLYFNNGKLVLASNGIEDGIKINIHAKAEDDCEINVCVNGVYGVKTISQDEFKNYEFTFTDCNNSQIEITSTGKCLVDAITLFKETFSDKGKAQLCLDSETTLGLVSGKLSVNGAITVDGKTYGLVTTQIGNVNKLPKINLV